MTDRLEWEALVVSIAHELPQPVVQESVGDGSIVFVGGRPGEVVVRLTRSTATVAEYAVDSSAPHDATPRPIVFGSVRWRRMPEVHAIASLNTLIRAARDSRRAKYRTCLSCQRPTAPEAMFDADLCMECQGAA